MQRKYRRRWEHEMDVVMVPAQAVAECLATLVVVTLGARTLLLEVSTQIGGNTLMSGGIMPAGQPANPGGIQGAIASVGTFGYLAARHAPASLRSQPVVRTLGRSLFSIM